jgi:Tfp pilus assembly protein PilX
MTGPAVKNLLRTRLILGKSRKANLMGHYVRAGEDGMVLVLALILLLILTLIGISAISTTTFETGISGNERVGADAFYASEALVQIGLDQLPDTRAIPRTKIGESSYGWSGDPTDKSAPMNMKSLGCYAQPGYDVSVWGFNRYQINGTGESFGAMKEIEVQATNGPIPSGTQYNN